MKFPTICKVESNVEVNSTTSDQPENHCNPPRTMSETSQVCERRKTSNWARYGTKKGKLAGEFLRRVLFNATIIEWGPS